MGRLVFMMRCRQRAVLLTVGNYIRILGRSTAILETTVATPRLSSSIAVPQTACRGPLVAMGGPTPTVFRVE